MPSWLPLADFCFQKPMCLCFHLEDCLRSLFKRNITFLFSIEVIERQTLTGKQLCNPIHQLKMITLTRHAAPRFVVFVRRTFGARYFAILCVRAVHFLFESLVMFCNTCNAKLGTIFACRDSCSEVSLMSMVSFHCCLVICAGAGRLSGTVLDPEQGRTTATKTERKESKSTPNNTKTQKQSHTPTTRLPKPTSQEIHISLQPLRNV